VAYRQFRATNIFFPSLFLGALDHDTHFSKSTCSNGNLGNYEKEVTRRTLCLLGSSSGHFQLPLVGPPWCVHAWTSGQKRRGLAHSAGHLKYKQHHDAFKSPPFVHDHSLKSYSHNVNKNNFNVDACKFRQPLPVRTSRAADANTHRSKPSGRYCASYTTCSRISRIAAAHRNVWRNRSTAALNTVIF